ncbi:metallophosphoesterase [Halopenitus sp. POP-27]|uniref:metallophosphoesterase n=1 Tax=Halopenitus sp. POP-27 TaxID=2994425 RepID=UPI0024684C40|nr:metallophosphoesterase [Halopenitus sp. POP-27]
MLTVVSDTHSTDGHRLTGRTLRAIREADVVIHAGDFHREPVLDAFDAETDTLRAVFGNNADAAIRDRLPEARTVEYAGVRFAVTHTRRGGETALALFGRERAADVVVFGHSHRPTVTEAGDVTLVNPGSHAQPRGNRPAHAEFEPIDGDGGLEGRLVTPDGDVFERFRVHGTPAQE